MSDSLWPHGLQHARLPCPSTTPRACSNSCPLSWWYHPTISSSVVPFSSCLQSFPVSEFFPMSQFFTSGGQSIQASASASVLPMNIQDWSPCSPSDPQESFPTPQFQSINSLVLLYLKLYNLNYICKISFTMYCKLVSGSRDSVMDIFRSPFCPPCQVICRIIR